VFSQIFVGFVVSEIHTMRVVSRSREQIPLASTTDRFVNFTRQISARARRKH
jgi:hypothetical protein